MSHIHVRLTEKVLEMKKIKNRWLLLPRSVKGGISYAYHYRKRKQKLGKTFKTFVNGSHNGGLTEQKIEKISFSLIIYALW